MFKKSSSRQRNLIAFVFILTLVGFGVLMAFLENHSLKKHKAFTQGRVIYLTTSSKSTETFVRYSFSLRGNQYTRISALSKTYKDKHLKPLYALLLNKTFPVVYDSTDPDNAVILISAEDYKKYDFKRPDSLENLFKSYDSILNE